MKCGRLAWFWPLLAWLAGCTPADVPPQAATIRMGLANAPLDLDPRYATDASSERVNRLLYQRLVEFDGRGLPVPGVADWQRLSPTHYHFVLQRPRAHFCNGAPLTARDVVATYRFVLDPHNASPQRAPLTLIERVEARNDEQIDFFLSRADPLFPAYLLVNILPAGLLASGHAFETGPVGSGSFCFIARPQPGRLLLERRRDHQMFALIEVKNPTVRVLKLLRGEIDLLQNDLSPELAKYLKQREEVDVITRHGTNFSYLGCNMERGPTADPRVRRALALAIDRRAIIDQVLQGGARPAETLFPPEHWAGNPGLEPIRYDPAQARALLRAAGYGPDRPLRLVYKSSSDPFRIRLATIIQAQLHRVGIEVELRSYDWGTFFGDIKAGRFQLYGLTWVGLRTPDSLRYIFASDSLPPQGANRGRYANPQVDRLLKQAEGQGDLREQAATYRRIEKILHDDLPYIPLWYEDQLLARRHEIRGYRLRADGSYDGLNQVEWRGRGTAR